MAFILKEGTTGGTDTSEADKAAITKWLGETGMIIRTKDQEASAIQAAINEANANRKLSGVLKEVTGIERGSGESEEDYAKRAVSEKLKELTGLQTKLKDLEAKGLDGSELAKDYKERLDVVTKSFEKFKADSQKEIADSKLATFNLKVESEWNNVVSKFSPTLRKMHDDPAIDASIKKTLIDAQFAKFKSEIVPSEVDGVIIFKDKSGTTFRKQDDGSFKGLEEIVKPYFEPIIDKEYKAIGGGSGQGGNGGGEQKKDKDGKVITDWGAKIKIPPEVKSQIQLTQYLQKESKLEYGTKDFDEAFVTFNKNAEGKPLPVTVQ